jgi:nucleotidyltransferase/DNA polymerase involved in DNA repair
MRDIWAPVILHVDMDAFFASVEQLCHPEWREKPVIVGADPKFGKGRGVVSTASYEARKFGVHSAMPISKAYQLCPNGIFVQPSGNIYSDYSRKVFDVLYEFTPLIEVLGSDEAFLDATGSWHLFGAIEKIGIAVKQRIKSATGLTASIGIAPSKSVAKIASDWNKPDGLTIVPPDTVQSFLDPLSISKLFGVGNKMYDSLVRLGVKTVKDLRGYPQEILEQKFGKMGSHLYRMARGIDKRRVQSYEEVKSVSNEITFGIDQTDPEYLMRVLLKLCEKVSGRLRNKALHGKSIQLKLRFDDFTTFTRRKTLNNYTNSTEELFLRGKQLMQEFLITERPIRLIGIGVSNLRAQKGIQTSIWDEQNRRKQLLDKVVDEIQKKFGKSAICHADSLNLKNH